VVPNFTISFILLLLSASIPTIYAQQKEAKNFDISGIIEDENGEVLKGANITASNLNQSKSTQSDSEGKYQIKNLQRGVFLLEIRKGDFIAHHQIAVNPENLHHNITINTSENELDEVHLRADSFKTKMEKRDLPLML
jgi:hypothetical protein